MTKKIQIPYDNKFKDIWEYQKAYLEKEIDFSSFIGPVCPICGRQDCYRRRKPYWRYAIEIEPCKKDKVPIARFECRSTRRSFSLLPVQLIPYHQYTLGAIAAMILLALQYEGTGRSGCQQAVEQADGNSDVTAFLVWCWIGLFLMGLRRAHALLSKHYQLSAIRTAWGRTALLAETAAYVQALSAGGATAGWPADMVSLAGAYVRATGQFFLGRPSQQRAGVTV